MSSFICCPHACCPTVLSHLGQQPSAPCALQSQPISPMRGSHTVAGVPLNSTLLGQPTALRCDVLSSNTATASGTLKASFNQQTTLADSHYHCSLSGILLAAMTQWPEKAAIQSVNTAENDAVADCTLLMTGTPTPVVIRSLQCVVTVHKSTRTCGTSQLRLNLAHLGTMSLGPRHTAREHLQQGLRNTALGPLRHTWQPLLPGARHKSRPIHKANACKNCFKQSDRGGVVMHATMRVV